MTKWLIALVVMFIVGIAMWMLHYGDILVAFVVGLAIGYIVKTVRRRQEG